jgi:hypothetical protein
MDTQLKFATPETFASKHPAYANCDGPTGSGVGRVRIPADADQRIRPKLTGDSGGS